MKYLELTLPSPAENLACDEALLEAAESGESGEVLRVWESPVHFVVVGYSNKLVTEVEMETCVNRNVAVLRRCSGGGTVVQGPGCLNYAVILRIKENGPTAGISTANRFIMERHRAAMENLLGRPVRVQGHTDLTVDGRKFSGNSQRRRKHFLLFHGTFLLNFDLAMIGDLLKQPTHQPCYREQRGHNDFVMNLNVPTAELTEALRNAWGATEPNRFIPTERIEFLVETKYSREDWNRRL